MILDKEEHRQMLLSLIDGAHFPGSVRKQVNELADAIEKADLQVQSVAHGSAYPRPLGK